MAKKKKTNESKKAAKKSCGKKSCSKKVCPPPVPDKIDFVVTHSTPTFSFKTVQSKVLSVFNFLKPND